MKYYITILTFLAVLIQVCTAQEKEFVRTKGGSFVVGDQEILLRGFNLGNWMVQEPYMFSLPVDKIGQQKVFKDSIASLIGKERMQHFYDVWLDTYITKRDIDSIAAWGFNSIRLPMHYNLFTLSIDEEPDPSKQTWFKRGFELVDRALEWCKANRIYLFLDLHAAPGGQGNTVTHCDGIGPRIYESKENWERTVALWKKLAERYVNEEWIGGYDLLNEPNYGFTDPENDPKGHQEKNNEPLRQLQIDITDAIRSVDKNHLIIMAGNGFGGNYIGMFPLWDDNMAFCFHKYWNFNTQKSINGYLSMREKQNAPIWMSEAGENTNTWFNECIALLEENNVSWSWWTYKRIGLPVPIEATMCDGFKKVLDYWRGRGPRPSADEAYAAFMQLAEDHKIENAIYHPECIDAMTRQTKTIDTRPFKPHVVGKDGGTIYAVDFDMGRNEYAYFDKDVANYRLSDGGKPNVGNRGWKYRNDGVDIYEKNPASQYQRSDDQRLSGAGYYVGHTEADEWLQYTINVDHAGTYALKLTAAADDKGAIAVHFTVNGKEAGEKIDAPPTGGQQEWKTFDAGKVSLEKGENRLRLYVDKNGVNIDRIELQNAPVLKGGNLSESIIPPPSIPMSRSEIEAGLKSRDRALLIASFWLRDPYIVHGPDDYYYLTGTIPPNDETRAKDTDSELGVRLWRSKDLIDWEYRGKIFTPDLSQAEKKQIWAPELHWLGDRWALVHCPADNSRFALGPVGEKEPKGPWAQPISSSKLGKKHDPSLFLENNTVWMIWTIGLKNATIAPLNKTITDWAGEPVTLVPAGNRPGKYTGRTTNTMGHEGAGILKIGEKYVYYGTGWSTDVGRRGSYNLYYATADKITGPYGPRRFIGRFLGHGNLFQTPDGQWWCTAFANANVPPIPREGIETRDLSDSAYTINQCGTTIVPVEVIILPDGDIHIRALDPAYATPGPDEVQQFK